MDGSNMRPFPPAPPEPEWWVPNSDIYISEDGRLVIGVELAAMKKEVLVKRLTCCHDLAGRLFCHESSHHADKMLAPR